MSYVAQPGFIECKITGKRFYILKIQHIPNAGPCIVGSFHPDLLEELGVKHLFGDKPPSIVDIIDCYRENIDVIKEFINAGLCVELKYGRPDGLSGRDEQVVFICDGNLSTDYNGKHYMLLFYDDIMRKNIRKRIEDNKKRILLAEKQAQERAQRLHDEQEAIKRGKFMEHLRKSNQPVKKEESKEPEETKEEQEEGA